MSNVYNPHLPRAGVVKPPGLDTEARRFLDVAGCLYRGVTPPANDVEALTADWRAHVDTLLDAARRGGTEGVKSAVAVLAVDYPDIVQAIKTYKPQVSVTLADLAAILPRTEWVWAGYVPKGYVSLVAGAAGSGKSALVLWLAKSVTTVAPWPDGSPNTTPTGKVVWCDTEATQAILLERAQAWGIPLENIIIPALDPERPLEDVLLDDPKGWEALEREVKTHRPPLVVIDSLRGSHRSEEKDAPMQALMSKLANLARDHQAAVIVVHHLRKRNELERADVVEPDRVRGSGVIVAMSRLVLAVDRPNGDDLEHQRLSIIKNNLGKFAPSLGFRISDAGLAFGDAPEPPHKETTVDRAVEFLKAKLRQEPIEADDLITEAEKAGISYNSLTRARQKLKIDTVKVGKVWMWTLPVKSSDNLIA